MDGRGYPYHLRGAQLSEPARVLAVCDVYQALCEKQPYREGLPTHKVWAIIGEMARSGHLDGDVVRRLEAGGLSAG